MIKIADGPPPDPTGIAIFYLLKAVRKRRRVA